MVRALLPVCAILVVTVSMLGGCGNDAPRHAERSPSPPLQQQLNKGEVLFRQYCAACHPDGGNVTDPERTLRGSALRAHHIAKPQAIVHIMRKPISRMLSFDAATISDTDARIIADYVLYAFR